MPDTVFSLANQFAASRHMSRSALFTVAVDEYIQRHQSEDVTKQLNAVYAKEASSLDPVFAKLQSLSLTKETW